MTFFFLYPENIIELFSTSIDQVPAQINKLPQSSPFSSPPAPRKQQPPEDHRAHKRHHWNAFSPSPPASARKTDPLSSAPGCLLPPGPGHTFVLISRTQSSCPRYLRQSIAGHPCSTRWLAPLRQVASNSNHILEILRPFPEDLGQELPGSLCSSTILSQ